jgi:hypothetical protein
MIDFSNIKEIPRLTSEETKRICTWTNNIQLHKDWLEFPARSTYCIANRNLLLCKIQLPQKVSKSQNLIHGHTLNIIHQKYSLVTILGQYDPDDFIIGFLVWHPDELEIYKSFTLN